MAQRRKVSIFTRESPLIFMSRGIFLSDEGQAASGLFSYLVIICEAGKVTDAAAHSISSTRQGDVTV